MMVAHQWDTWLIKPATSGIVPFFRQWGNRKDKLMSGTVIN